jgi:hypothetical protein
MKRGGAGGVEQPDEAVGRIDDPALACTREAAGGDGDKLLDRAVKRVRSLAG